MKPKTVVDRTVSEHEESNADPYRATGKSDAAYGLPLKTRSLAVKAMRWGFSSKMHNRRIPEENGENNENQ